MPSGRATQRRRSMLVTVVETRILVDASGYLSHVGRFACGEQASGFGPRSAKVQRTVRAKARSVAPSHSQLPSQLQVSYGRLPSQDNESYTDNSKRWITRLVSR